MRKLFFMLMLPLLAVSLAACGGDDDDLGGNGTETTDSRLDAVLTRSLQDSIRKFMPIYGGNTPPVVEGAYKSDNVRLVYSSDNKFKAGREVVDNVMRFSNQNTTANTLDFDWYEGQNAAETGNGVFISGSGNNFTAFFNTTGTYYGATYKAVRIYSGTKSSGGIKNLYYAIVMLEANGQPQQGKTIMDAGVFRVIKENDGISSPTSWNPPTAALAKGLASVAGFNE